ncbi:uncharacterized mitochondrial protein-like protein [Tanacetum coccineum]
MDVKSVFLHGKIKEEVYVCQPLGFEDPDFPDRVYKVEKALYMSSMGELTFFLGLQVKQKKDGIFISQDIYVADILKKFEFAEVKTASTPMETQKPLLKDEDGKEVDVHMYRSMNGSLMYLTSSRPDIMFAVCACARYQVNPKVLHLHVVKRIFSDYARASLDKKSTTGVNAGDSKLMMLCITYYCRVTTTGLLRFWSTIMAKTINGEEQLHALVDGKEIIITESSVRRDLQLAVEEDEAVHKGLGDSLVRAATTSSSLEAEQDSGNINKTQSKATPNESSSQGTNSGGGPWCQETMGDTTAQTRFESVSKHSNDSLLVRGNKLRSDEDSLKHNELIALCTTLQNWVLDLEKTKTTQHNEIDSLKRKFKKLEKENRSRTHRLKRLYKGRIDAIDADEEITLVSVHDVGVLYGEEVFVAEQEVVVKEVNDEVNVVEEVVEVINTTKLIIDATQVSVAGDIVSADSAATTVSAATITTATITTVDDITLAQALKEMKSTKPKKKEGKGKEILIEPVKPMNKKDQIRLDEEIALNLQDAFDEEERLAKEKAKKVEEANIALIETWDYIQAKIDVDHKLAERMEAQEQEELSIEENATLFQQLLQKRRKHFNMEGYKLKDLKLKEFDSIQEMFDRAFKRVNTFENFRIELVEGKEKRAGTKLIQEIIKKQKVEDDIETIELKQLMEIIPDREEVSPYTTYTFNDVGKEAYN